MKDKVMYFIIRVLVGAIITTSGFLIYNKCLKSSTPENIEMNQNENIGEPPTGGNNMEEPPEKPDSSNDEKPPAKPDSNNSNSNT